MYSTFNITDINDSYTSKKAAVILTFWYKCSQYKSLAKRPRNESIEKQRSNTN
ncbi:7931_t:CDS:2 [Rhizophagus irregularis]|nr:7931_t:CDS:2 [Rhizophagus irregularis]